MRVVCPACAAAYEVPDSLLTAGRAVRCARCTHQWVPLAVAPAAPVPQLPPPRPAPRWADDEVIEDVEVEAPEALPETPRFTAMDRLALHRASVEDNPWPLRLAWGLSFAVVLLLIAAAFIFRVEIAHAWPPSQRLYDALGLMQPPSVKP